jgi:hypothetical protein
MSRMTIARIKARCTEDGDCLLWTGKVNARNGIPMGTEWVDGKDCYVGVRRRAYEEYHGVTLGKGDQIATCGNPACLAKNHLERITVSERVRRMHKTMDAATRIKRSKSLADAAQRARGKVAPEVVAELRETDEGPYVAAKRLGVSGVVASRIKRGVSYRTYEANPFAGLLALNDSNRRAA